MSADGDNDEDIAQSHDIFDDTAYQGCYIFEPSGAAEPPVERPAKRRKTNQSAQNADSRSRAFPSLFGGKEDLNSAQIRRDLFHEVWSHQEEAVDRVVKHVDAGLLADIVHFVKTTSPAGEGTRIPTGLVLTGPNYGVQSRLLDYWRRNQLFQAAEEVITLDSSQAPTLTTALRNIVKSVIVQRRGADRYQSFLNEHKRLIPLNFDLELLQTFVKQEELSRIVISILDVEVYDAHALSDLIEALSSWVDRLPIVLLFGIATTAELFEARLPKRVVKLLQTRVFDVSPENDSLYQIYQTVQDDAATKVWLGPALSGILVERSKDEDESPESFARSMRYIYMSHFFANPLSVLLVDQRSTRFPAAQTICNAIRNTDSFHKHVESLIGAKEAKAVKRLLIDDEYLMNETMTAITDGQRIMIEFRKAIGFFLRLHHSLHLPTNATITPFEIDSQAFSGRGFLECNLYNDTLASLEKLASEELEKLLEQCPLPEFNCEFSTETALSTLRTLHEASAGIPIRSARDPKHSTTSTTISRNNTVSLAKHAPKLSKLEKDYTALVQNLHCAVKEYFESRIIDPHNLFMNESFVYDHKMPLAGAFAPRPRYAIERALDRPGDYLGCECCTADERLAENVRSDKLPPTSLLWQLCFEAGSIVNVRDLWEAFSSAVVDLDESEEDEDAFESGAPIETDRISPGIGEQMALALFYRCLAELRMLGFIKSTKKKFDCVAKAAWKGL